MNKAFLFFCLGAILGFIVSMIWVAQGRADYCTNNDTRDRAYEEFVELSMHYNKNSIDSIKNTKQYKDYIREHGEWFNNQN